MQSKKVEKMERRINWSGHTWIIKTGYEFPGPNKCADDKENVYLDDSGNLHLKIISKNGRWYCSEIYGTETFGYGKYIFEIESAAKLADNVVLGMFVYQNDEQEIDIEFSRWGIPGSPNMVFVVQQTTATKEHNNPYHHEFYIDQNASSVNQFFWSDSEISFQTKSSDNTKQWKYPLDYIPKTDNEKVHLNLWLVKGDSPINGQEQEVILKSFRFEKEKH